jgi:AraC family transcriptional regulator, regulatory protein of adaptative response / DNA-3-methyladenine glycosylase II
MSDFRETNRSHGVILAAVRTDPAQSGPAVFEPASRVLVDPDRAWRAVQSGDARFDGWFFCGVKTTGIYCRPSCPARTPKRENVRFFATAAAAQGAGFRACKRCRPDATPGSPEWDLRADLVGRAMRLIADGVVDREGVPGLARRLGYTERHVHRQLVAVVGAGPLAVARAQRAQTARVLLETTALPIAEVAFAAGFSSVRQCGDTIRDVFALSPSALRARVAAPAASRASGEEAAVTLRLPYRAPFDGRALIRFLARRAVPGVEEVIDDTYRRSLRLPFGAGVVELAPDRDRICARFWLDDLRDLGTAIQRSRALLDLDSDPLAVEDVLGRDALLAPLVAQAPGRRVPGHVDADELAVRAVLGQQISLAAAATLAARLVVAYGEPLARSRGTVTHAFPTAHRLADADPDALPMPAARRTALLGLSRALADGGVELHPGADRVGARRRLQELPGIGPWTAEYVAMRALRDPDAFLATDLGVRHALTALGRPGDPKSALAIAGAWRPYRAYALVHLWATLAAPAARAVPAAA